MNETQPIPLTDLRVGNAVTRNLDNEVVIVTQINSDAGEIRCHRLNDPFYKTVVFSGGFSGIPLTEEWFIRFGFKFTHLRSKYYKEYETDYRWRIRHREDQGYAYIVIDNNCCFDDEEFSKPIKYVSDLQNIYYFLTGTELTIK